ncbi:hypothetical protein Q5P01_013273 [Channa striata]|uniref:Uncharacterized protein n=1 Tax=Channa striata TaxID=64152 RepID=A0AA88SIY9_CHASR|nr:hypothetical protein Q5P01_013273 [Channa striata]
MSPGPSRLRKTKAGLHQESWLWKYSSQREGEKDTSSSQERKTLDGLTLEKGGLLSPNREQRKSLANFEERRPRTLNPNLRFVEKRLFVPK